ncbi:prepilin-type N-terminal cleavage/methylation domain-containing protein [Opitutia bacterium ISCC 51]|nr:prepilin-type N-terminal cleavage/methylation domain-containing protein [Opitutae bacterium ISCC 51]QXD27457.1 prepilin-type N-terminal cleavage/methylation domain-containing protein [Opitutae bacterium ISCC 52]
MISPKSKDPRKRRQGFTIVELITVIAIISILLGLLISAVFGIQNKAKRAKTEALFGKLITSLTVYRKDNGAYPDIGTNSDSGDRVIDLNNGDQWQRFSEIMALSLPDGSAIEDPQSDPDLKKTNPKLKRYFDLQLSELEDLGGGERLVDAFGNPHIYIVVDANLDGRINKASLPDSAKKDLRQRIVIYTTDEEKDDYPELKSWDS